MAAGIVFLSPKDGAHLIHPLEYAHENLLVQLRALGQIRLLAEVGQGKHIGAPLCAAGNELRGVDLGEALVLQVFFHALL